MEKASPQKSIQNWVGRRDEYHRKEGKKRGVKGEISGGVVEQMDRGPDCEQRVMQGIFLQYPPTKGGG